MFAITFLFTHWYLSLFCQTFYLHRYVSHRQFELSTGWNRFFLILTIISQGPSFLRPRHYMLLHARHHAHSDEELDPHSPLQSKNVVSMMSKTFREYLSLKCTSEDFPRIVAVADSLVSRIAFVLLYSVLYLTFTESYWYLLLVPIHSFMGPIHGAIVNWCGHKYGYRNHSIQDNSKNTLFLDFLMMGELYQNNHHANPLKVNFADRWYELDLTYFVFKILKRLKVVQHA
ncbi:fatty acid desaturase [Halobacteriovorax marinus]|uniref:fatty acid desaturase n=1 Tax=Halobacteriovorax marinus TaxID=97084 RepID=UPI003A905C80